MADLFPRKARKSIADDLSSRDLRFMLVKSTYTENEAHEFLDNGGANDPVDHEMTVSGYARQAMAGLAVTDDGIRVKLTSTPSVITWTGLASGETVGGAIMFDQAGGADNARRVMGYYDTTNIATNGGNITLTMPANGWLNF